MAKITKRGYNQGDLVTVLQALRNRVFGSPGLSYGSGSPGLVRMNPATADDEVAFSINGTMYRKAAADDIAASIAGTALTNLQTCIWRVEIDTAGAITSVQGGIVTNATTAKVPTRSPNKATLGTITVTGYTFTPGTTTMNNAGVTFADGDPDLNANALEA